MFITTVLTVENIYTYIINLDVDPLWIIWTLFVCRSRNFFGVGGASKQNKATLNVDQKNYNNYTSKNGISIFRKHVFLGTHNSKDIFALNV